MLKSTVLEEAVTLAVDQLIPFKPSLSFLGQVYHTQYTKGYFNSATKP